MKTNHQRGVIHILLLAVLVLVALSVLARCDIDRAGAEQATPYWEHNDALESNPCRSDLHLAGPAAL